MFTAISTQLLMTSEIFVSLGILTVNDDRSMSTRDFESYQMAYAVYFAVGNVDSMVSCAFVILTFPFASDWYRRMCGCAHTWCMRIWLR